MPREVPLNAQGGRMKAKVIWRPEVVPSERQQYLDLAEYFASIGEIDLSKFYEELSHEYS